MNVLSDFMNALEHSDTIKVILTDCGESSFPTRDIHESILQLQEQHKWIPCSERLPEEDGVYLTFQKIGGHPIWEILSFARRLYEVDEYDFCDDQGEGFYELDSEWGYIKNDDVLAWMPLPEPWKEDVK